MDLSVTGNREKILTDAWQQHQTGNIQQALRQYESALQGDGKDANAWCYIGIALHDLQRYREAVQAYENAIKLQPNFAVAWNNMGNSFRHLLQIDEAESAFATALIQNPKYGNAFKNRAALRATIGRFESAVEDYTSAMRIQPDDVELHRNLGVLKLLLGEFQEGWHEYRYRWKCRDSLPIPGDKPKWTGQSLEGRTILLYYEQGLGDTLQFIRYANVLKTLGARVLVKGQSVLAALLRNCEGIDAWFDDFMPVNVAYDYHCSLIDCADILKTDLTNIPSQTSYLKPAAYLQRYWHAEIDRLHIEKSTELNGSPNDAKVRVGIAWQGNPKHQSDQFRSMALKTLEPLITSASVQCFVLQHGVDSSRVPSAPHYNRLIYFPASTDQSSGAFMDTAAIITHLDLVVTTDTSIAHLAGSLGRPVWLMLNAMPDWRWLLDRSDSPWYPTMRLFRQNRQGEWQTVVQSVVDAIQSFDSEAVAKRNRPSGPV